MKSSASGLYLLKEGLGFYVTNESYESTESEEYTESSLVDIYMYVGAKVGIKAVIISIALIAMSIDPEFDSEWTPR